MNFVKGLYCPVCENTFLYIEAKNRSFSFQSALNCPHCDQRLQNPEYLRKPSLFYNVIFLFFVVMVGFFYAIIKYENIGFFVSLPFVLLFICWVKSTLKLKDGYISMVRLVE